MKGDQTGKATALAPPGVANLLHCDGRVELHPDVLPAAEADRLFSSLMREVAWRQEIATIMGRRVPVPRLTAWYGEAGYVYSGIRHEAAPLTPALLELRAIAARLAGQPFNSVLLNLYRHGRDSVSWHADDEAGLGREPLIASLSLGAERKFQFRHRRTKERIDVMLPHGSCLLMGGATQHHWLHQIPKTARPTGPRINLTFRRMLPASSTTTARARTPPSR